MARRERVPEELKASLASFFHDIFCVSEDDDEEEVDDEECVAEDLAIVDGLLEVIKTAGYTVTKRRPPTTKRVYTE